MAVARDKFWIFGVRPGQDDLLIGKTYGKIFNPQFGSKIKPAEAAFYLDVPNMIMVNCEGIPVPYTTEAEQYAFTFTPLKKVLWSSTGSGGFRFGNEEKYIADLALRYENIAGAFMDDFFGKYEHLPEPERTERYIDLLREIRGGLDLACRPMELYVVWYTRQTYVKPEVFIYINGVTLWTDMDDIKDLERDFKIAEQILPNKKKMFGIYLYSFRNSCPIPQDLLEFQCELGLQLMREGRLDGLIFEANSVMGVGFPTDKWARDWIHKVKDFKIPD